MTWQLWIPSLWQIQVQHVFSETLSCYISMSSLYVTGNWVNARKNLLYWHPSEWSYIFGPSDHICFLLSTALSWKKTLFIPSCDLHLIIYTFFFWGGYSLSPSPQHFWHWLLFQTDTFVCAWMARELCQIIWDYGAMLLSPSWMYLYTTGTLQLAVGSALASLKSGILAAATTWDWGEMAQLWVCASQSMCNMSGCWVAGLEH